EHAPTQGLALDLDLLEQPLEYRALAGLVGHQVPQVTDFALTDAVDATEALLQPVGIPRQVVVDHQVCVLEVDALTRCVGCQQDLDVLVLAELLLDTTTLVAVGSAMD